MDTLVLDIESDGLLEDCTKIHCLSYYNLSTKESKTLNKYSEIIELLSQELVLIGHNIIQYDIPVLEKLLGIKVKAELVDTLGLSWTLFPKESKHSLEAWGEFFGIKKIEITDWDSLSEQKYNIRCETDVQINTKLWYKINSVLNQLYSNPEDKRKYIEYISFKLDCLREQESTGITLDIPLCIESLSELEALKEEKISILKERMPKIPVYTTKKEPKKSLKQDGSVSLLGAKWDTLIKETGSDIGTKEIVILTGYKEPNPNSHDQIKDWLYTLGWVPENIKHQRNKETSEIKKIPQIKGKNDDGEVCESIKKLMSKEPALEVLNGLFVLSHRISVFKGFLRDVKNNRIYQGSSGFTNTLRLQHTKIVNLPGTSKLYAENIRKCFISESGNTLIGADLSGIEDITKRHFIYKYDPEYVLQMNTPGYDSHLDLGVLAGFLSQEQSDFYKWYDEERSKGKNNFTKEEAAKFKLIKDIRHKSKTTNYSATYKVGKATLSRTSGLSLKEAENLLAVYWKRNKAILDVENSLEVKLIGTQKFIKNPVNNFWYSLRADKDKFSTLNQGTAVYCFDRWVYYIRKKGVKLSFQVHDELTTEEKTKDINKTREVIQESIKEVNSELKLNTTISCSINTGSNYADCH